MKQILLAIGCVWVPLVMCGQVVFQKTLGDTTCYEEGYTAVAVGENTLVSAAINCQGGSTNWESYLILLDENGDTLWTKTNELPNGFVRPTGDGHFLFLGGNIAGFVHDTAYVTKTDSNGNAQWTATLFIATCRTTVYDLVQTADGGYAAVGIYSKTACTSPSFNGFLWKIDSMGNTQWAKFYGGTDEDQLFSVKQVNDGYYLFGFSNSTPASNRDYWLIKTDLQGDTLWTRLYGDLDNDFGYGMDLLDNGIILFGYDDSARAIKTDLQGNFLWEKNLGDACGGTYFKVKQTHDQQLAFLMYGNTNNQCSSTLIKTNATNGNEYWRKNWGGLFREFQEPEPGTFLLAGNIGLTPDVYVVRFDTTYIDSLVNSTEEPLPNYAPTVSLYPNPASEIIRVNVTSNSPYTAYLYSLQGKLLSSEQHFSPSFMLQRNELPAGIYLLQITSREGYTSIQKVVWQ